MSDSVLHLSSLYKIMWIFHGFQKLPGELQPFRAYFAHPYCACFAGCRVVCQVAESAKDAIRLWSSTECWGTPKVKVYIGRKRRILTPHRGFEACCSLWISTWMGALKHPTWVTFPGEWSGHFGNLWAPGSVVTWQMFFVPPARIYTAPRPGDHGGWFLAPEISSHTDPGLVWLK